MRIKATIAYDGSLFFGFQRQSSAPTVTGTLEQALHTMGIDTEVIGSGRTDRNVHASGQVIHFDLPDYWHDTEKLKRHLNKRLKGIHIRHLQAASSRFHARYDAKRRLYRYLFTACPTVWETRYVAAFTPRDEGKLRDVLKRFEGNHDFASFCKSGSDPATTRRHIYRTGYYRIGRYGVITFLGNAFLRSQVRLMVEAAMRYADGNLALRDIDAQLENIHIAVRKPAPAEGLYLARIFY